jgi:flagellar biosynthesis anti-sigma factor FlgM
MSDFPGITKTSGVNPHIGTSVSTDKKDGAASRQDAGFAAPTTPVSQLVKRATLLANQGPPIDETRLTQIARAIALGEYQLDLERLAQAIINFDRGA